MYYGVYCKHRYSLLSKHPESHPYVGFHGVFLEQSPSFMKHDDVVRDGENNVMPPGIQAMPIEEDETSDLSLPQSTGGPI
jgi:hypothetical protein